MPTPDPAAQPVVVWLTVIGGALAVVLTGLSRAQGWWGQIALDARRTNAAHDDADIAQMRRQLDYVTRLLEGMRHYQAAHDDILAHHRGWDMGALEALARAGVAYPAPPPLYPPDETTLPPQPRASA